VKVGAVVSAALLCAPTLRAEPAPGVTFTKIADTSTIIPAGQWAGEKFKHFGIPAIDNGNVVFLGVPDSATGGDNGVYGWKNGALGLVADPSVPHPSGGTLREFREPTVRGDTVAFRTEAGGSSIFHASGGVVTSIGTMPVTRFSSPSVDGDDTWFYGYSFAPGPLGGVIDGGVYRAHAGSFENVAPHGSPTPSAPEGYSFYFLNADHRVIAQSGQALFWAGSTKPNSPRISGLYSVKDGEVERVVDSTMPVPGSTGGSFGNFEYVAFDRDGEVTIFRNGAAIYVGQGGTFTRVAVAGEPAPGGGTFAITDFDEVVVDSGRIAFTEGPDPIGLPSRLYSDLRGSLERIVGLGDTLGGSTVVRVQIGPEAISGNQIAFFAWLSDGGYGVYVATIPEPSATWILMIVLCLSCVTSRSSR